MIIQDSDSHLDMSYYLRFLVLGLVLSLLIGSLAIAKSDMGFATKSMFVTFLIVNSLLFPFSRYAIDCIISFAYGSSMIIKSEIGSIYINFCLWALTTVIAPIYFICVLLIKALKLIPKIIDNI